MSQQTSSLMLATLWDFACNVYQNDGVQDACLWLQDEAEVDVPLLLTCLWLGQSSVCLSPAQVEELQNLNRYWTQTYIAPLRSVRRAMKIELSMNNESQWESTRAQIKGAELHAEKMLLKQIEQYLLPVMEGAEPANANKGDVCLALLFNVAQCFPQLKSRVLSEQGSRDSIIHSLALIIHAALSHIKYHSDHYYSSYRVSTILEIIKIIRGHYPL